MDWYSLLTPSFIEENVNCAQISRDKRINKRLIQRYYQKFLKGTPIPKKIEIGRPKIYPAAINTVISNVVRHKEYITSQEVANKLNETRNIDISDRTVRRRLETMEYGYKKPTLSFELKQHHIVEREKFYNNYNLLNWENVIFSDESTFQVRANVLKKWVKKGTSAIFSSPKFQKKLMVWGAFSHKGKSKLFLVEGTLSGQGYVDLLTSHLLPFIRKYHRNNAIFQQDNASIHTCRLANQFFSESDLQVMEWPACSPDLNPIENLWGILKRKVAKQNPESFEDLKQIVISEWNDIPLSTLQNLISDMPIRLAELDEQKFNRIKR